MLTGVAVANLKQKGSGGVKLIQYSPFKKQVLASATENGSIYIWDCNTRQITANFQSFHNSPVTGLAFSAVNHMLMCSAGLDQKIHFYDIQEKRVVKTMELDSPITSLAFYGEGHTIAVGTLYGSVQVYDLRATSSVKTILRGHEGSSVNWIEFVKPRGKERIQATRSASFNFPPKEPTPVTTPKPAEETYPGGRFRTIEEIKQEAKLRVEMKRREQREGSLSEIQISRTQAPTPQLEIQTPNNEMSKTPEPIRTSDLKVTIPKPPIPIPEIVKPPQPPPETTTKIVVDKVPIKLQETSNIFPEEVKSIPESKNISESRKKVEVSYSGNEIEQGRIEGIEAKLERQDKAINGLRDDIHNLHVELIRQFMIQQSDMRSLLEEFSTGNSKLLQEIDELKAENLRLKHNTY